MESLSRGRTSQFHSLHTRKLQIAHARHTLRRARLTHRQRLLTLSSIPLPTPTRALSSTPHQSHTHAARYTTAIHRLKRTLKAAYSQARTQHLRAIHMWEREVGDLLVCLSGPGDGRVGWVWAAEEPEEEEEEVGDGEYVPPLTGEEEEEEEEDGGGGVR